jgi:hypothetical protein
MNHTFEPSARVTQVASTCHRSLGTARSKRLGVESGRPPQSHRHVHRQVPTPRSNAGSLALVGAAKPVCACWRERSESAIGHSAEATQEVPPRTTSGTSDPAQIARSGASACVRVPRPNIPSDSVIERRLGDTSGRPSNPGCFLPRAHRFGVPRSRETRTVSAVVGRQRDRSAARRSADQPFVVRSRTRAVRREDAGTRPRRSRRGQGVLPAVAAAIVVNERCDNAPAIWRLVRPQGCQSKTMVSHPVW